MDSPLLHAAGVATVGLVPVYGVRLRLVTADPYPSRALPLSHA